MIYQIIACLVALLAVLALYVAFKALVNRDWVVGFLRGVAGLSAVAITALLVFSARDIFSYRAIELDKTLVTMSFRQQAPNKFQVDVQETAGAVRTLQLEGEQWQLDTRMFKWTPLFGAMGFNAGYRLDSLRGRYLVMDMDRKTSQEPQLLSVLNRVDVWNFFFEQVGVPSSVQALLVTPGFIPMADGAIFEVALSGSGLTARPLNDAAKKALASW
jgi:hypothetical protein